MVKYVINILVSTSLSACYSLLQKLHSTLNLLSSFELMPFFPICCNLTCHTFVSFPEQTPIFLPKGTVVLVPDDEERVLKNGQIPYM